MKWADKIHKMHIEVNAETPKDAQKERDFGDECMGLVRTEYMFFDQKDFYLLGKWH